METFTANQVRQKGWGAFLNALELRREHIAITRRGVTLAIAVPYSWYEQAKKAMGGPSDQNAPRVNLDRDDIAETRQFLSSAPGPVHDCDPGAVRNNLRAVLNNAMPGRHIHTLVRRYDNRVAAIVPQDWYEQANQRLGASV